MKMLAMAAALSVAACSVAGVADAYDGWMMNWFRGPDINGYPECVPSTYDPAKTIQTFKNANNFRSYKNHSYVDDGVSVHEEIVKERVDGEAAFTTVSDYPYCLSHYNHEYWKVMKEMADDLQSDAMRR